MTVPIHRRSAIAPAALALALALVACGPSEKAQGEAQAEIEALLADYLPALAEAYRTGDLGPLEGIAAPREIERVNHFIRERAQEGRLVDPTLHRFEIEAFSLFQHSNVYLTTRETWDLRIRAAGSDRLIQEELGKTDRFRYQVRREGDRWRVLTREVVTAPPPAG